MGFKKLSCSLNELFNLTLPVEISKIILSLELHLAYFFANILFRTIQNESLCELPLIITRSNISESVKFWTKTFL